MLPSMTLVIEWLSIVFFRYVNNAPQFSDVTRVVCLHGNDGNFNSLSISTDQLSNCTCTTCWSHADQRLQLQHSAAG